MKEIIKYIENATKEMWGIDEELEGKNCDIKLLETRKNEICASMEEIIKAIKEYEQAKNTTRSDMDVRKIQNYLAEYKANHPENIYNGNLSMEEMKGKYAIGYCCNTEYYQIAYLSTFFKENKNGEVINRSFCYGWMAFGIWFETKDDAYEFLDVMDSFYASRYLQDLFYNIYD